jgi:single-stranded-DNA-specific exonuclease
LALATRWSAEPYSFARARALAADLGVSHAAASILVRRGYGSTEAARRFLAAAERHDASLLAGRDACELILRHLRGRIVIHGDYDVDGVCATAVLVRALRALGATPRWHLPAREDGYGLSRATIDRFAADGVDLLVTVDCGIGAVDEVAHARRLGIDVVVTDHHIAGTALPDCPLVHPAVADYPCPELCGTAVAHKLAEALFAHAGQDPRRADDDLDLVALATVADVVPLRGENRRLVRAGLDALARTRKPGLRALMEVARCGAGAVDEHAIGFRLAPRLNAAGRLRRADAALELVLCDDEPRAAAIADELDVLNRERQDTETRILFAAESARSEHPDSPAYVLASDGWHPGVIGIVAGRLVDRYHRPCVVIALEGDAGRGSGRSIRAYDLHAGLVACAPHLRRFGGHRAAAGLEIDRDQVEPFRAALCEHAASVLSPDDLVPVERVDAVVGAADVGVSLAEELDRMRPFGHGNPRPTLLVPAVNVTDVRPMGDDGLHARCTLAGAGGRARAVAFRTPPRALQPAVERRCHAAVSLELSEWMGVVEPRLVLRALCPGEPAELPVVGDEDFWGAFHDELTAPLEPPAAEPGGSHAPAAAPLERPAAEPAGSHAPAAAPLERPAAEPARVYAPARAAEAPPAGEPARVYASIEAAAGFHAEPARAVCDRRGRGFAATAADLIAAGESVLVVCAEAARRRAAVEDVVAGVEPCAGAALAIASWDALLRDRALATPFAHLVALDPPRSREEGAALERAPCASGRGFAHLAWAAADVAFARAIAAHDLDLRTELAALYRELRAAGPATGEALRAVLCGGGGHPRPPRLAARLLRVLLELGLVEFDPDSGARVLDSTRTELDRSAAYRAYRARFDAACAYLDGCLDRAA